MNAAATAQIASYLNIAEAAIARVEEWAHVLFVVAKGIGARFVSKKIVKKSEEKAAMANPIVWRLEAQIRRQEGKKWVGKIIGLNADPARKQTLDYQFIEPIPGSIEWGKYGMKAAEFELAEPGYYKDSDEDLFEIYEKDGELFTRDASFAEIISHFKP